MVVRAMHEVVPGGDSVKVFGVGQRVWRHESLLVLVVARYTVTSPTRTWPEVLVWVRVLVPYCGVGGSTVLAEKPGSRIVGEAVFYVHLIPETLRVTVLGAKGVGSSVNIEVDTQTQAIVDTVDRYMAASRSRKHVPA